MQFALIENQKIEAAPGLQGLCPGCSQPVISKCGKQRIWHWAHRGKKMCDNWWEPETQWHRNWKNKFPGEWQESIHYDDQSGEKHIADVRTKHGLVIEFQHSHLDPQERDARESFYKNMVWVVDGMRLKNDYRRFLKGINDRRPLSINGFFLLAFPGECFPAAWLASAAPVLFDFQNTDPTNSDVMSAPLWCLLPGRAERNAVIVGVSRKDFVETLSNRAMLLPADEIISACAQNIQQQRAIETQRNQQIVYQKLTKRPGRRRYARF